MSADDDNGSNVRKRKRRRSGISFKVIVPDATKSRADSTIIIAGKVGDILVMPIDFICMLT